MDEEKKPPTSAKREVTKKTVRVTVIGDSSSNTVGFLRSVLTGAGSAVAVEEASSLKLTTQRIIKDVFLDFNQAKKGVKSIDKKLKNVKEQQVRLILTAETEKNTDVSSKNNGMPGKLAHACVKCQKPYQK